jgi:hypothetical protein
MCFIIEKVLKSFEEIKYDDARKRDFSLKKILSQLKAICKVNMWLRPDTFFTVRNHN